MSQPSTQSQSTEQSTRTDSVTSGNTAKNADINDPGKTGSSDAGGLEDAEGEITQEQAKKQGLPEQKHAGAVGYGPDYANKTNPTIGDKITGIKEELVGKITKNPELVEKGHERKTGELKKKEQSKDENDPFAKPEEKKTEPADNTKPEPLNGGKSSEVDTAADKSRLTKESSHPAARDEGVQRAAAV